MTPNHSIGSDYQMAKVEQCSQSEKLGEIIFNAEVNAEFIEKLRCDFNLKEKDVGIIMKFSYLCVALEKDALDELKRVLIDSLKICLSEVNNYF